MQRRIALAVMATTASLWMGPAFGQAKEVSFGFISTESAANLKSAWQPVLDDMQKATGLSIKAFFAPDYAGIIEAMRFNKVQVAWMGNKSCIEAVDRSQGEVFAKTVNKDGTEGYYSLLVVPADSPIKTLDDVIKNRANLTLGLGDPNSTSGNVVPSYFAFGLKKVDPARDFKRTVRANHETNMLAVVNKQVDVATNNTENWDRFSKTHAEQLKQVREIWRSPMIPSDPMLWRADLDAATKTKIRDFLLSYGAKPEESAKLATIGYSGFKASSNAQLNPIRQLDLAGQRTKLENDTAMSADDKAKKLAEIDAKLAALDKMVAAAK